MKILRIIILFLTIVLTCNAQKKEAVIDTIYCNVSCIEKFIEIPSNNSKSIRIYAIYNDKKNEINEIIPVSKNVYEYIELCKQNNITPSLGIKLRNGQISSVIRFKPKYIRKT